MDWSSAYLECCKKSICHLLNSIWLIIPYSCRHSNQASKGEVRRERTKLKYKIHPRPMSSRFSFPNDAATIKVCRSANSILRIHHRWLDLNVASCTAGIIHKNQFSAKQGFSAEQAHTWQEGSLTKKDVCY